MQEHAQPPPARGVWKGREGQTAPQEKWGGLELPRYWGEGPAARNGWRNPRLRLGRRDPPVRRYVIPLSPQQLRRHVLRGAQHSAASGAADQAGRVEIGQQDVAVGVEQDVLGLYVAGLDGEVGVASFEKERNVQGKTRPARALPPRVWPFEDLLGHTTRGALRRPTGLAFAHLVQHDARCGLGQPPVLQDQRHQVAAWGVGHDVIIVACVANRIVQPHDEGVRHAGEQVALLLHSRALARRRPGRVSHHLHGEQLPAGRVPDEQHAPEGTRTNLSQQQVVGELTAAGLRTAACLAS
eukprot:scaffold2073_cov101-Isochrysis_galbana.AAC.3